MKFLQLSVFILLISFELHASSVKGIIRDVDNKEEIIGATIQLKNQLSKGTASGLDGSFVLNNIDKFPVVLTISYMGYKTLEVTVTENQSSNVLIELEPDNVTLTEVIVLGETAGRTDASARMLEKNASNVLNVMSARAIEISPDITVANVVQRISGVSVERSSNGDGQYAILRGMDKRYNYTLVNGVKIPSSDNKNRFVPLDIFPAELLDRLEVTKTLTAAMEGDAVGGAVNMVMKDAPARMQLTANVAAGYNALYFQRDFKYFKTNDIQRQSPFEKYGDGYPAKVTDFSTANMIVHHKRPLPDLFAGLSFGNRFFDNRFGMILALSYQNSYRGNNSLYFDSGIESGISNRPVLTKKSDRFYYEQQQRYGLHGKFDYVISPLHKIQWYNAYMDFTTSQIREITTTDLSIGYDPVNGNYSLSLDSRLRFNHQSILNSTLKGEHSFNNRRTFGIDWSAVYSKANNETPDNVYVFLSSRVNNFVPNPSSVVTSSGSSGGVRRRWEHNSDADLAGYTNFWYKLNIAGTESLLSAGGMYRDKERTSFFNQYGFAPFDPDKPEGQQNNLIQGTDWNTFDEIKLRINNPHGSTGDPLNYDATEKIGAAYLQARVTIDRLEMNAGIRVENTEQGYTLKHSQTDITSDSTQRYTDLLPSLHVKYALNGITNIKASYFKSINRPSFFEIVPYRIINEEYQERGNPALKHAVAHNVDFRFEYFPRTSEQIMAGIFYKQIENPIEAGIFSEGQSSYYMPANFGTAYNYGLEIDVTKYFRWFGVKANYTYTKSTITTNKVKNIANPDPDAPDRIQQVEVSQTRPLNNQAAHVANLSLLAKSRGWDAQLAFSYTDDRLYIISRFEDNDIWQAGFLQTDISVEKAFDSGISVYAKATNLLDTPMVLFLKKTNPANENVDGYETFRNGTLVRRDYYGQTFRLGIKYKF